MIRKLSKPLIWILFFALAYHLLMLKIAPVSFAWERIRELGYLPYTLMLLGAGGVLYAVIIVGPLAKINEWRELKRQRRRFPFSVKVLVLHDPFLVANTRLKCECGGFFAKATERVNRNGIFCLKCGRDVDSEKELGTLILIGGHISVE